MTTEQIEELKRLNEKGVAPEWVAEDVIDSMDGSDCVSVRGPGGNPAIAAVWTLHGDARLIAAARNALPRLLAERERLLAALRECISAANTGEIVDEIEDAVTIIKNLAGEALAFAEEGA